MIKDQDEVKTLTVKGATIAGVGLYNRKLKKEMFPKDRIAIGFAHYKFLINLSGPFDDNVSTVDAQVAFGCVYRAKCDMPYGINTDYK
jgi:hypothetical protein